MTKKITLISLLAIMSANAHSAKFDDWEKVTVDITEKVQHFGGMYTCNYEKFLYGASPFNPGGFGNYTEWKTTTSFVADSTTARPTILVPDTYIQIRPSGQVLAQDNYPYPCNGIADLPRTYIENRVVEQKVEYRPIQPFPSLLRYEFGSCHNRTRTGTLSILGAENAANMIVRDVTGTANFLIYSGPASEYVNYSTAYYTGRELSVKLDSGSTYYLNVYVPSCSSNVVPN